MARWPATPSNCSPLPRGNMLCATRSSSPSAERIDTALWLTASRRFSTPHVDRAIVKLGDLSSADLSKPAGNLRPGLCHDDYRFLLCLGIGHPYQQSARSDLSVIERSAKFAKLLLDDLTCGAHRQYS